MDEVSLGAATMVGELKDGEVREYEIHPEDFGLSMKSNRGLKVKDAAESKEMVLEALGNVEGTPREIVTLNAGAALYAAGIASSIADGIAPRAPGDRQRRGPRQARRVRRDDAEAREAVLDAGQERHPREDRHDEGGRGHRRAGGPSVRRRRRGRARNARRRAASSARCARKSPRAGRP